MGTLDVLVGLSDELAKLDSFVERYASSELNHAIVIISPFHTCCLEDVWRIASILFYTHAPNVWTMFTKLVFIQISYMVPAAIYNTKQAYKFSMIVWRVQTNLQNNQTVESKVQVGKGMNFLRSVRSSYSTCCTRYMSLF